MTGRPEFSIVHLMDAPEVLPILARRFVEEWAQWYGPDGPGDAEDDLKACRGRNALPLCLVAVSGKGDVPGTAALKSESVGSEHGGGPWLAAVLVDKAHQGQGIGTALVEAIENEARQLGFESIYTSTDSADGTMARRHWQPFGETDSLRGPVTIYRKRFNEDVN